MCVPVQILGTVNKSKQGPPSGAELLGALALRDAFRVGFLLSPCWGLGTPCMLRGHATTDLHPALDLTLT